MKLNVLAFGLACGLIWGFGVFCLPWWVMAFKGATRDPLVLGHIYRGFNVSPLGSVIGLGYGLVNGLVRRSAPGVALQPSGTPRRRLRHADS